jgi:hypothetical protein
MAHGGSPASECAQAAWHRPKPLTRVMNLRCTVAAARSSDRGVSQHLGVHARCGYDAYGGALTWPHTTSRLERALAFASKNSSLSRFSNSIFSTF